MAYKHDVFLSYLHVRPSGTWVHEHFLPYFAFQLGNALNRWPEMFVDFQRKVAKFSEGVARVIGKAPQWSAEWETPAWTDDVIDRMAAPEKPKVQQPRLG